jgi:hypothetical protein
VPIALAPYSDNRAPIALAPYTDNRAPGIMASCAPPSCSCRNILLHVLFETYCYIYYSKHIVTIVRRFECDKLFSEP